MKKLILFLLVLPIIGTAQESERFVGKGLLATKGTLAIGSPTAYGGTNMYISGNTEYYLGDNVSFRGSLWIFLGTSGAEDVLRKNSTLFTGYYYHFNSKNGVDPYIGLEPGLSWTQLNAPEEALAEPYNISTYPQSISPVGSVTIGINYYATNFAHLFIEGKYVHGIHVSDIPAVSLSEFRIAFGFGFNMWAIKKN